MTKKYPSTTTSRTLDPNHRSLTTVVGKHDKRITDADVNLIQDLQDYKRSKVIDNMVFSGALQHKPFVFDTSRENVFTVPAFDIMFNGEVVTIGGNKTTNLTENKVVLPNPSFWTYGQSADPAAIYVVYLELWYRSLNPEDALSSSGYYIDKNNVRWFYTNGCVDMAFDPETAIADDVLDPFQGLNTTSRAQVQWAIRTQRVPVSYDFSKRRFGLDALGTSEDALFGRAFLAEAPSTAAAFKFQNMGTINGDYGLWRAGDGASVPAIPTLDGYSYAMPLGVVFQRNLGNFDPTTNPHGCADSQTPNSGKLSIGISGRYDFRYADVVYPEDVVDTRLTVSMEGYDWSKLLKNGFVDLVNGNLSQKIGRGESPGSDSVVLGSELPYTLTVSQSPVANTDHLGAFDGFMNGFGSDARTFYTVKEVPISQKTVGSVGTRWAKGDAFTIDLDATGTRLGANITYLMVQALVQQADNVSYAPVLMLSGQLEITGIGTRRATGTIIRELSGTAFDPGMQSLYVTVGVSYDAGSSYSLKKITTELAGGRLQDKATNKDFSVFGVSEYATYRSIDDQQHRLVAYNPQYSNKTFGVRAEFIVSAATGTPVTVSAQSYLQFTLPRTGINNRFAGLYIVSAVNNTTKESYPIYYTAVDPGYLYVNLATTIPATTNIVFSVVLDQTAQLSYNPAVKAISAINETVLFGNYANNAAFPMDHRIRLISQKRNASTGVSTLVFATADATLNGIGGNTSGKFIFVADAPATPTRFKAYPILDTQFFNGVTTVQVPSEANVTTYPFFMVASLAPAFSPNSSLALTLHYQPYQGEGNSDHTYSVLHSEEFALVTTNGTGAAPVVGLRDVYPYNRELPIVTVLPTQPTWNDAELANQAVSNYFDGNYEAKRFNNVEHTFITPLHTNDFIEPVGGWKRKKLKFSFPSGRGFAKVSPHIGFAIRSPKPKATLGDNILSTVAPIQLYVNNVHGADTLDGLTPTTPKRTIAGAVAALPPVLRHPCFVYVIETGSAYKLSDLQTSEMKKAYLGDGDVQSSINYCMAGLSHTLQDQGRLYIGRAPESAGYVEISAEGFAGFGDGPTSAFVVTDTRVIFTGIKFSNFINPAVYSVDSYVDFVDCQWLNNFVSGSFTDGSSVTVSHGSVGLTNSGTGFILSDSSLTSHNVKLITDGGNINTFYVCERTSNLTLSGHIASEDTLVGGGTSIVLAKLSSTVVCEKDYTSSGKATINSNSVLTRTTKVTPFAGGVDLDSSSMVMTDVS
jgi:hypothetical protein